MDYKDSLSYKSFIGPLIKSIGVIILSITNRINNALDNRRLKKYFKF